MSKYQEALNNIVKSCCPNCDTNGCKDCSIEKICNATAKQWVDTLQELVDKATPKKVNEPDEWGYYGCPVCDGCQYNPLSDTTWALRKAKYCPDCGQALDWSDIEDE